MTKRGICIVLMLLSVEMVGAQEKHCFSLGYGFSIEMKPYLTNEFSNAVGPFVADYSYRVCPWLELGGLLAYTHVNMPENTAKWNTVGTQVDRYNNFMVLGKLDFVWFGRPNVKMYSGIAGGLEWRMQSGKRGSYTSSYFASHITVFGISAGKKMYGNLELGYGCLGMMRLGIGYKL